MDQMPLSYTTTKDGAYVVGDLVMIPHPPERIIADLYFRFESQGLLEILFHEGARPKLSWFLKTFSDPETSTLACYRESPNGEYPVGDKRFTPLGMTWINKTWKIGENFKKAECGMGFVRKIPTNNLVMCGLLTIEWAFQHLALDALIGSTPTPNRAAVLYGQKLGFQQTTPLEGYSCWNGKLCSVVLQSMTRDRWMRVRNQEVEL